jgi:hypothetical protein
MAVTHDVLGLPLIVEAAWRCRLAQARLLAAQSVDIRTG